MEDLERLKLLESILCESPVVSVQCIGQLANDVESLCTSIENTSPSFKKSFGQLWAALEVLGVRDQEQATDLSQSEISDIKKMVESLVYETRSEIKGRLQD